MTHASHMLVSGPVWPNNVHKVGLIQYKFITFSYVCLQVSQCNRCRVRYDPVPRHMEWGWAEFHCPHPGCGRQFR